MVTNENQTDGSNQVENVLREKNTKKNSNSFVYLFHPSGKHLDKQCIYLNTEKMKIRQEKPKQT